MKTSRRPIVSLALVVLLGAACSVGYKPNPPPPPAAAPQLRVAVLLADGRVVETLAPTGAVSHQVPVGPAMTLLRPLRGLAIDKARFSLYALQPEGQNVIHVIDTRRWKESAAIPLGNPGDAFTDIELAAGGGLFAAGSSSTGDSVLVRVAPDTQATTRTVIRPAAPATSGGAAPSGWLVAGAAVTDTDIVIVYGGPPGGWDTVPLTPPYASTCPPAAPCGRSDGGIATAAGVTAIAAGAKVHFLSPGEESETAIGFQPPIPGLALAFPPRGGRVVVLAPCDGGGVGTVPLRGTGTVLHKPGPNSPCGAVLRAGSADSYVASAPRLFTFSLLNHAVEESPDLGAPVLDALPD